MFMHIDVSYVFQSIEACGNVCVSQYNMVNVHLHTVSAS